MMDDLEEYNTKPLVLQTWKPWNSITLLEGV